MKAIILTALAIACALGLAAPSAAAAQTIGAQDPQALRALFDRWGYQPGPISTADSPPVIPITVEGISTVVGLGGCTDNRACNYIVLIAVYTDVANPPFEWLNIQNNEYDMVTATRSDDGKLSLRTSVMLGNQGIPESTLRAIFADWVAVNNEISQRAVQAGLAHE